MKLSLYLNDYETEKVFSYLRWVFLLLTPLMFYYPPIDNVLQFNHETFVYLLVIGSVYMTAAQTVFHRMDSKNRMFPYLIKAGIAFDYIAFMWLLILTGGADSILFPISYLIVMHATVYWKTKGAFLSCILTSIGYTVIVNLQGNVSDRLWFIFAMNLIFLWIVGVFGSLIVLRERKHLKMKEIYHQLVVTDYLTGLFNHRHFQEHLRYFTERSTPFVLIMGDIDHFKPINDCYGHLAGDDVLRTLGQLFGEIASEYEGQAFRYGGEEFAFLLPFSGEQKITGFLEKLYIGMNEKKFTNDQWSVTMSFGVSSLQPGQSPDQILSVVDRLLYQAKEKGKNQACFESGTCFQNKLSHSREAILS